MVLKELLIASQLLNPDTTVLEQKVVEPTIIDVSQNNQGSLENNPKTLLFENALDHQFRYYQNVHGEKGIVEAWFKVEPHKNVTLQNMMRFNEGNYFGRTWLFINSNDLLKESKNTLKIRNKNTIVNDNKLFSAYFPGANLLYIGNLIPNANIKGAITASYFPAGFNKQGYIEGLTAADIGGKINLPFNMYVQGYAVLLFKETEKGIKTSFSNSEIGFYKKFNLKTFDLDIGYRVDNGVNAYENPDKLYHSISLQVSNFLKRSLK
jgi:hypothetical protein